MSLKQLAGSKIVRQLILVIIDLLIVAFGAWFSLALRFSITMIPFNYAHMALVCLPIDMVITVAVFYFFRLYNSVWTFASIDEITRVFLAATTVIIIEIVYKTLFGFFMPRSVYFMSYGILLILVTMSRLSIRIRRHYFTSRKREEEQAKTMIVGAGSAGSLLINELAGYYNTQNKVVCVIDDNINKKGKYINGVEIVGTSESIPEMAAKYNIEEIFIAIPSAPPAEVGRLVDICNKTECRVKILPSITKSLNGKLSSNLRDISYEDLLGRDPVEVNQGGIKEYITGKTIMVTGGGGSIGSELCRQIMGFDPKELIIFDIYENNAYDIQMELWRKYPKDKVKVIIGSIRDNDRLECVFDKYRPEIVFHAAAHKHVPLMEFSPNEAIKNNCMGTRNLCRLSDKYGVTKFVLISTDKAVRPTSVMGASKRICEMIIQDWAQKSKTSFAAVRFGNVLGSNGSVIPLFLRQIDEGGPVTVTDPDITRFFMTIPEAVSLVLQAGVFASGGEIFVLDMGKQVRIYDLAENLIKMKGYRPNKDIKIEITGLRPGEKLYEEILMDEEGLEKTSNNMIYIGSPIKMDYSVFEKKLDDLIDVAKSNSSDIKEHVAEVCETYMIK